MSVADAIVAPIEAVRFVFPGLDAVVPIPGMPRHDTTAFMTALERELSAVVGLDCRLVAADPGRIAAWASFERADGAMIAIDLPIALAAALVDHRCGGSLTGDHSGAGASASVLRMHGIALAAAVRAASSAWPGSGDWAARDAAAPNAQHFGAELSIGEARFALGFAVALPSAPVLANPSPWPEVVRDWLEATVLPVRAVLHEATIPLTRALRLQPGDVLPIDTPRDVCLRVGRFAVARGTIAPDADGVHAVTIRGAARRGIRQPEDAA